MKIKQTSITVMLLAISLSLAACGGGSSSSDATTDTSLVFKLFPASYFEEGYSASYALTGSFSTGDGIVATLGVISEGATTFNSQTVAIITEMVSVTNTATGAAASTVTETYFTSAPAVLGSYRTIDGVIAMADSMTVIPSSGTIGDFGVVGNYTLSDGTRSSVIWALEDGSNGNAKLTITTTTRDSFNRLDATSRVSWLIAQDGTRKAVAITITYHALDNMTVTMSGNKT